MNERKLLLWINFSSQDTATYPTPKETTVAMIVDVQPTPPEMCLYLVTTSNSPAATKAGIPKKKLSFVLSMTSEIGCAPENAFYMLSYADMVFPVLENHPEKERLTQSNYVPILSEGNLKC